MSMVWGTITDTTPLRVTLDGDTTELPFAPDSLVDPLLLAVNDRVRCDLSGRRVVIVGRSGGDFDPTVQNGLADRLGSGFVPREIVPFTSSGSFSKGAYPWLRAVLVRCIGGGGGGGGAGTTGRTGAGGGGGEYAESLITDISGLASTVTVTVGGGGGGGAAGNTNGSTGVASSFGLLVVARPGGGAGGNGLAAGAGGTGGTGDLLIPGSFGTPGSGTTQLPSGVGGASGRGYGGSSESIRPGQASNGFAGRSFGGGGGGAISQGSNQSGGAGASGIVIVELYS